MKSYTQLHTKYIQLAKRHTYYTHSSTSSQLMLLLFYILFFFFIFSEPSYQRTNEANQVIS